ncbi:hypothetical protein SNEBB_003935 [Seison nebaliae]|nr:hypothetical protein SNEBB_003935 [Seison nebaliae]
MTSTNGILTGCDISKTITNEALFQQLTQDTIYGHNILHKKKANTNNRQNKLKNENLKKVSDQTQFKKINSIINELAFHLDLLLTCNSNAELQNRAYNPSNPFRTFLPQDSPFSKERNEKNRESSRSLDYLNIRPDFASLNKKKEHDEAQEEWFKFARIADIICFWMLTLVTLAATLTILIILPAAKSDI